MKKRFFRILAVLIVGVIIGSVSLPFSAVEGMPLAGATVTPNIFQDDFDDVGEFDYYCSLREALYTVIHNADYGGCSHTGSWDKDIVVLLHGTFQLTIPGTEAEDQGVAGDLDLYLPGVGSSLRTTLLPGSRFAQYYHPRGFRRIDDQWGGDRSGVPYKIWNQCSHVKCNDHLRTSLECAELRWRRGDIYFG